MATRQDQRSCPGGGSGDARGGELRTRSILETESLDQLLEDCLPSFGGAYLRRLGVLLDEAIGRGLPMTL